LSGASLSGTFLLAETFLRDVFLSSILLLAGASHICWKYCMGHRMAHVIATCCCCCCCCSC
jgi:hypothetical protein